MQQTATSELIAPACGESGVSEFASYWQVSSMRCNHSVLIHWSKSGSWENKLKVGLEMK